MIVPWPQGWLFSAADHAGHPHARKVAWLLRHPESSAGAPERGRLMFAAAVGAVVTATAYGDMGALMDRAEAACTEGRCPCSHTASAG